MPAAISSAPSPAAPATQHAMNGASPAGDELTGTPMEAGTASFAVLLQKLAVRQPPADGMSLLPGLQAEDSAVTEAVDAFTALLDHLDVMGLIRDDLAGARTDAKPSEVTLAVLVTPSIPATPVAPPVLDDSAISAVGAMTKAIIATQDDLPQSTACGPEEMLPTGRSAGLTAPDRNQDASGAHERGFSSQLVVAIEGNRELQHLTGSTATSALQVIAPAGPHNTHAPGAVPSVSITQPVGTTNWSEEVGNRIVWLVNRMESRAELVLTPPQMGRIEVSLTIAGDQANASFVSVNPVVREMLESALPRLREVLADAGIQLGQAQVSAENARQSAQQEKNGDNSGFDRGLKPDTGAFQTAGNVTQASPGLKMGRGLVDVFA